MITLVVMMYFIGGVSFILVARVLNRGRLTRNFLNPGVVFGLGYSMIYFVLPGLQIALGVYQYSFEYSLDSLVSSLIYFLIFGFVGLFSYHLFGGAAVSFDHNMTDVNSWQRVSKHFLLFAGLFMILPFITAFWFQFNRISELGYFIVVADRTNLGSGYGYMLAPLPWLSIFICLLFVERLRAIKCNEKIERWSLPIIIFLVFCSSMCGFMLGSRSQGLMPFILITILYYFIVGGGRIRLSSLIKVNAVIIAIVVIGIGIGAIREEVMGSKESVLETSYNKEKLPMGPAALFKGLIGAFGTAENMFWMLAEGNKWELQYGKTFVAGIVGFVPRQFWPNKPVGGGPVMTNMIRPGSYELFSVGYQSSVTTGLPVEAVMNFGFVGLFIIGIGYGFVLSTIAKLSRYISTSMHFVAWFLGIFLIGWGYFIGEFFGVCSWLAIYLFPLLVLIKVFGYRNRRGNRRVGRRFASRELLGVDRRNQTGYV